MNDVEYDFNGIYNALMDIRECTTENRSVSMNQACAELKKELNKFFTSDFVCRSVTYNPNTDRQFFGLYAVETTLSSVAMFNQLVPFRSSPTDNYDFKPAKPEGYKLEIDGRLFRNGTLSVKHIAALMIGDLAALNSAEPSTQVRNMIDNYLATTGKSLCNNSIQKGTKVFHAIFEMTLHNLTSVFARYDVSTIPTLVKDYKLDQDYEEAISIISMWDEWHKPLFDTTGIYLSWFFDHYTNLYESRYVEMTFKQLMRCESSQLVRDLIYVALKSIVELDPDEDTFLKHVVTESKHGLVWQMKRNGIKGIEEDLYEYNMRYRNVEDENDAILLMRQINSRMGILEDYLANEEMTEQDRQRWSAVYKGYSDLRIALSKKAVYNRKQYGLYYDYSSYQQQQPGGIDFNGKFTPQFPGLK